MVLPLCMVHPSLRLAVDIYLAFLLVVVKVYLGAIFEFELLEQRGIVHSRIQQLNLFEISSSGSIAISYFDLALFKLVFALLCPKLRKVANSFINVSRLVVVVVLILRVFSMFSAVKVMKL